MEHEEVVIERAKTDPEAFGRLYDTYYQPVFGFLLSRTHHPEVAQDLASETFFHALKSIHRYKPQGKPFKSWLFAIAMAQVGNYYRSRAKYLSVTLEEGPEVLADEMYQPDVSLVATEDASEQRELITLMKRALKQLNQKQQNILTLRYFSHLTIAEIAAAMKMKEGTVKSHIHRALKKLQGLMAPDVSAPEQTYANGTTKTRTILGTARV